MSTISPLAYIHPDAKIVSSVTIEPFAVIQGDVSIGDGTHVMSNAVIFDGSPAYDYTSMLRSQALTRNLPELEKTNNRTGK